MRYVHSLALAVCLAFLYSCAHDKDLPAAPTPDAALAAKAELYCSLTPPAAFETDCDGLLFRSLTDAACGRTFDIELWRDGDGQWQRNPSFACSRPTSRDMVLGVMRYAQANGRLDLLEQTWDYIESHDGTVDPDEPGISSFGGIYLPYKQTLALLIQRLGGRDHQIWKLPAPCVGFLSGFQAHLQAVLLELRTRAGVANGGDCLKDMTANHPTNAYFAALYGLYTGDQAPATQLLLNEAWWPAGQLPSSNERCDGWINQRDDGADWQPCPTEGKTHSGGDFDEAAAVILRGPP